MPKPRKVEKKLKPIIEPVATLEPETTIELTPETTITGTTKPSKREQIDLLLANPCPFYPDPTRLQYATEMWPWLKQLAELLE